MVAYAQASLVQLALLQQKVLLGSHDGSDQQVKATADANAAWMQVMMMMMCCASLFLCVFFFDTRRERAGRVLHNNKRVCFSCEHEANPPPSSFSSSLAFWRTTQARLDYNLDWERNYAFIGSLSYFSDQKLNGHVGQKASSCCGYCTSYRYEFYPDGGDSCVETLHVRRDCNANETAYDLKCPPKGAFCYDTMVYSSCACCNRE